MAEQTTAGAAGGAVVSHTLLGYTRFHALVGDARHQKKNVYDAFASKPVNTVDRTDPVRDRPSVYWLPVVARPTNQLCTRESAPQYSFTPLPETTPHDGGPTAVVQYTPE
ncbi:MAG: hypothetical protein OXF00_10195 [bacterium]|nr:hypothetical protein [bacterium]